MPIGTVLECDCGHRVSLTELLAHGFVVENEEPVYVYVRYRCKQCRTEGQHLMTYDEWNGRVREPEIVEKISQRFESLGPISSSEVLEFGRAVRQVTGSDLERMEV